MTCQISQLCIILLEQFIYIFIEPILQQFNIWEHNENIQLHLKSVDSWFAPFCMLTVFCKNQNTSNKQNVLSLL